MKKLIALILAALMVCAAIPAMAEANDVLGTWYGSMFGMELQLDLNEDGTCVMTSPMDPENPEERTWEFADGKVIIDGDADSAMDFDGETLTISDGDMSMVFTRERPEGIELAEVVPDAPLEAFAGEWIGNLVSVGGMTIDASMIGETFIVTIEGTTMSFSGGLFGGEEATSVECEYADGALTYALGDEEMGMSVEFVVRALADETIAVEMTVGEEAMTFYMAPAAEAELEPAA